MNPKALSVVVLVVAALSPVVHRCVAQPAAGGPNKGVVSDAQRFESIKRLLDPLPESLSPDEQSRVYVERREAIVRAVDDLVRDFPETGHWEEAQLMKLEALVDLARLQPAHLAKLLAFTEDLAKRKLPVKLAAEVDFAAIKGFVYGARFEGMSNERRMLGTEERYRAFLKQHKASSRRPTIYRSLIRSLSRRGAIDDAQRVLAELYGEFGASQAAREAQIELARSNLLGKPFEMTCETRDGKTLSTSDYHGRVMVIHYWSGAAPMSTTFVAKMLRFFTTLHSKEVQLLGVTTDAEQKVIEAGFKRFMTPWPQCIDENIVRAGGKNQHKVVVTPLVLVLDRDGIVRSVSDNVEIRALVDELVGR